MLGTLARNGLIFQTITQPPPNKFLKARNTDPHALSKNILS